MQRVLSPLGRADEQHQYVNPEIAHTIIHIDRWSIGTFENITNFLFPSQKSIYFWEPNQIGGATRSADSFFQRQRQNYEAVSLARAGRLERCTKVAKGQEDDRNDKSQPNHSYVNLPQIKWDFLVYLIIFCVRSSSKRPLEESITWRKPRPKELRSAGFMAFCWLGGRHRRYRNMVQRHLNSHVKDFSPSSRNECRERSERYVVGIRK